MMDIRRGDQPSVDERARLIVVDADLIGFRVEANEKRRTARETVDVFHVDRPIAVDVHQAEPVVGVDRARQAVDFDEEEFIAHG